jgi:hypothetical protein
MIHLSSDYTALDREIDRLGRMPDFKTVAELDAVLHQGFVKTQAAVHVETESLKASGKESSEVDKLDHAWEGEIEYGGPSLGPNNPVNYAIYEKARGAGGAGGPSDLKGDHDFMAPLPSLHPSYITAIKKGLAG